MSVHVLFERESGERLLCGMLPGGRGFYVQHGMGPDTTEDMKRLMMTEHNQMPALIRQWYPDITRDMMSNVMQAIRREARMQWKGSHDVIYYNADGTVTQGVINSMGGKERKQ